MGTSVVSIHRASSLRDCLAIWRWRNHASSRLWMGTPHRVGLLRHLRWFYGNRGGRMVFVFRDGPRRIGTASVRLSDGDVSIVVDHEQRGKGYALQMLDLLSREAVALGVFHLRARIARENKSSLVAFRKAGFSFTGFGHVHDDTPPSYLLVKRCD